MEVRSEVTTTLLQNWKCVLACTLVSMSPFQYGIDFGAIGGLQAMRGFLEVRTPSLAFRPKKLTHIRFLVIATQAAQLATTSLLSANS